MRTGIEHRLNHWDALIVETASRAGTDRLLTEDLANGSTLRGVAIVNPFDTHAVEEALRIKDQYGCAVTAISMGPPNSVATLRKCLALGADDAILVSDRAFGGADTLATSFVLAETIRTIARWGRLVVQLPALLRPGRRLIWAETAARRIGRLRASIAERTWYP